MKKKNLALAAFMAMSFCAPMSAMAADSTQEGEGTLGNGGEAPENNKKGIPVYANLTGEDQTVTDEKGEETVIEPGTNPGGIEGGEHYEITFPSLIDLSNHAKSDQNFDFGIALKGDLLGTTTLDFASPKSFDMTANGKTRAITSIIHLVNAGDISQDASQHHWKINGVQLDGTTYDGTSGDHTTNVNYRLTKAADFGVGLWKGMFKVNVTKTTATQ